MAESDDQDSRTEEPTEKRLSDAIEKGNTPTAREAILFGSFTSLLCVCMFMSAGPIGRLVVTLKSVFVAAGSLRLDDREGAAILLTSLLMDAAAAVLPVLVALAAGTIVASLLQSPPAAVVSRIAPQLSRISPASGWKRLYGPAGFVEFGKSLVKLIAAGAILWFVLNGQYPRFAGLLMGEPALIPEALREFSVAIIARLLGLAAALAIADLVWSRLRWRRQLRMTRQDIKDEMKQAEGDPLIKARIRSIARQRASRRMMEKLPTATMVIANPTHYAVALRYAREDGGAPIVVAKGVDYLALKIREIAAEHGIPVIEDRPLARSLYDQVEIDSQIPAEFYVAIAEIIHYLNSRGRLPRRPRPN